MFSAGAILVFKNIFLGFCVVVCFYLAFSIHVWLSLWRREEKLTPGCNTASVKAWEQR